MNWIDLRRFILLWLVGLYFRLPVFAASALAPRISQDLGLSDAAIGALTTLPMLMLAIGALPAGRVVSRLGARTTILLGLLLVAFASAGRGFAPDIGLLLLATALMGLGIVGMQTAAPSLVQDWTPSRIALGSAVYLNGMVTGEFVGAGLTLPAIVPLAGALPVDVPLAGGDWRMSFILWSIPAVVVAALIAMPKPRRWAPTEAGTAESAATARPTWRSARMWRIGLMLGSSISTFFAINAYMGAILEERGNLASLDIALALFNLAGLVGSMAMLRLVNTWVGRRRPLAGAFVVSALGLLGFLGLSGPASIAMAVIACFGAVTQLVLLLSLLPRLASGEALNGLVAGVYAIGYATGFLVPMAGGALAELVGTSLLGPAPAGVLALVALVLVSGRLLGESEAQSCEAAVWCRSKP